MFNEIKVMKRTLKMLYKKVSRYIFKIYKLISGAKNLDIQLFFVKKR